MRSTGEDQSVRFPRILGIAFLVADSGCRPAEPPPSMYADLGTEDRPLLPTGSAWQDPAIAKGTAEWHPFRKPEPKGAAAPASAGAGAAAGSKIESDIRDVVQQFNDALAEGKAEPVVEFLVEDQVESGKQVLDVVPKFATKLQELVEASPGENESLKKLAATLTTTTLLKLDVASIRSKGASEAVAVLNDSTPVEARFVLLKGEADGDESAWYIDHPRIRELAQALPAIQQALSKLDGLLADIKSGQISGEALAQQAAAMDEMLQGLLPGGPPPAKGAGSGDDK